MSIAIRKDLAEEQHQLRKASLRKRGVSTQTADLLPGDPDADMPTLFVLELQSYCDRRRAQEQRDRRENARQAFEDAWLRGTEIELHECQEKLHVAQDPSFLRNLETYLEILCDKLKTHQTNLGNLNTKEEVQERRRVCLTLGLLSAEDQHLVSRVDEPLPAKKDKQAETTSPQTHCSKDASSSDEASLFITPEPRSRKGLTSLQPDDGAAISDELLRMHSTRKRHSTQQKTSDRKRMRNTITRYYKSQT